MMTAIPTVEPMRDLPSSSGNKPAASADMMPNRMVPPKTCMQSEDDQNRPRDA